MTNQPEVSVALALEWLKQRSEPFVEVFQRGSLSIELYKPQGVDRQKPHDRDEVYVIISGTGVFLNHGRRWDFHPGDVLFVPAGVEHRFVEFTADFSTWVIFFGPKGGAK